MNKERAQHGETKAAARTSIDDISASRRGGLRSHKGPGDRTRDRLRNEARERGDQGPLEDEEGGAGKNPEPLTATKN